MKKLIEGSIKRRVTVAMFTIAVLLFGFVSFTRLKINLLPDLSYPTLTIRTEYPGAAPAEIENLISKPIEESVGVVKNVQTVSSISRSGQSDVVLEFAWGTDMDFAIMEVREKMDSLELPLDVKRPVLLRFDPSMDPIMRFALFKEPAKQSAKSKESNLTEPTESTTSTKSPALAAAQPFNEGSLKYLRRFADEQIKKDLESALGVAAVKISGGLEDEVQIMLDQGKLAQLNIPIEVISDIIGAENVNRSGGRLEEGSHQFLVRTLNKFQSVKEMESVIVAHKDGRNIYLRDVATVRSGYKERKAISRLGGVEAVEISIYKEGDANTVFAAREVEKKMASLQENLPEGVKMVKVYNQATFIQQAVSEVISAAVIGGLLAVFILYFFLRHFWTTLIISLSIPVSVIATFNLMYGSDLSLNIMSLGGIALGIGMLLDNSIVVLENISRYREKGKDILTAAREGTKEISTAVVASTLTTVAVFFPLVFVKGIAGQLFRDQALTITFSLIISLVVALTLIPMLASTDKNRKKDDFPEEAPPETREPCTRLGKGLRKIRVFLFSTIPGFIIKALLTIVRLVSRLFAILLKPFLAIFSRGYKKIENSYPRLLESALKNKGIVLTCAVGIFLLTLALIPRLGVELIPQLAQGEFRVQFLLPPGTPLEKTDELVADVQESTKYVKNIDTTFSVAGTGNRFDANPEQGGDNWGEISVKMTPGSAREQEEAAISAIRRNVDTLAGLRYKFYRPTLFSFKTPVEVEIAGFDLDKLKSISGEITRRLNALDRFTDVKSTMEIGHPEVQIRFDRERAAALGLNVYRMADRVVKKIRGHVATRYSRNDRKIDVLVRSREQDRASVEDIRQLIVNPESQRPVPLKAIADIIVGTGPGEIRRVQQERVALVTANLRYGGLGNAAKELNEVLESVNISGDMTARISGQNEEMEVSFDSLKLALLLAIFLVYLVMASQFESFLHPFVILFTIPLALTGAVLALWITNSRISVVVFIGAILLAGIVVNNAIVLIDRINQMRSEGMKKTKAIIEAGRSRLRPILMTMITTALGLLPLAIGIGEGAEVRAPMAITVIGGLFVSTLLTLVVIPVVYSIMDRRQ
ncbi:MAG: efflux RND transporter permease subunit [bacterium]|nr:efflux RND transporter permease subunit [bacterium]